jgi:hypothetical protein
MKHVTFLFVVCLAFQGMAQEKFTNVLQADNTRNPLFILKVDNQCLEINSSEGKEIAIDSIDPNTIKLIEVFKEKSKTTDQYGLKAQFGVVVIYFKEFDLLSKELQSKFEECK